MWTSRLSLPTTSYFKLTGSQCGTPFRLQGMLLYPALRSHGVDNEVTAEWRDLGNILPRLLQALILFEKERTRETDRDSWGRGEREGNIEELHSPTQWVLQQRQGVHSGEMAFQEPWFLEAKGQFQGTWAFVLLSIPNGTVPC